MDKSTKILLIVLAIALIVVGAVIVFTKSDNVVNNETTNNSVNEAVNNALNWINNEIKNEMGNEVEGNEATENETVSNVVENTNNNGNDKTEDENITENQKEEMADDEKAIELVKNKWGEDDSVTFKIDEKTEDGKYSVSVVDKNTTEVLMWYEADIKNETVEEK